jgi:7-cyano-7-deazaguanine synthase
MPTKALCVLDGGQISTACAALACQQFDEVHGITCNGGQRNQIELESAIAVADMLNLPMHKIIDLSLICTKTAPLESNHFPNLSAPTSDETKGNDPTFPSAHTILVLTLAANQAAEWGIKDIFMSVCKEDVVNGFERCQDFINLMSRVLGEGLWRDSAALKIHTPLIHLSKTEIARLAIDILGGEFQKVFELTHDCEMGIESGCGECQPCLSRDRDFQEIGVEDPIWKFRHPEFNSPIAQPSTILPGK